MKNIDIIIIIIIILCFVIISSCSENKKIKTSANKTKNDKSKVQKNSPKLDINFELAQIMENSKSQIKRNGEEKGIYRYNFVDSSLYPGKQKLAKYFFDVTAKYPLLYYEFILNYYSVYILQDAYFTFYKDTNTMFWVEVILSSKVEKRPASRKQNFKYMMEQTDYILFMYKVDVKKYKEYVSKGNPKKIKKDKAIIAFDKFNKKLKKLKK